MHWKETGGFEKLFALPGCAIPSRGVLKVGGCMIMDSSTNVQAPPQAAYFL